jgi:hypothetical protein
MRFVANDGLRTIQRGLTALGLVALCAGGASAQLVIDGNLIYDNNTSGTLAGQFTGTPPAPAAGCAPGMSASVLGTTTYTFNDYLDPLLPNAPYVANVVPSFKPGAGSPAFSHAVVLPNDGFFDQTCYAGAIDPSGQTPDWTAGWTYYDSTGANRQDLHLAGMPDPRPLAIYDNISLYSSQTWAADSNYEVRGQLRVKSQATLTIPAGVVVFEDKTTLGTIIIERGGKIVAVGTAQAPIIITSNQPPGSQARGDVGGLVINGFARTSTVNSCIGDSAASEGGAIGFYGGSDDSDNSGQLRYVRAEFSGRQIVLDNELNAFLFNAVGSGTQVEYLQAFAGADDCFEFFGGTVDTKHLIGIEGTDDGFDTGGGFRGRSQFLIIRASPRFAPQTTNNQSGDKGWEADNNEAPNAFDQIQCSGRANPRIANATFVGDKRSGPTFPGPVAGINWRRATAGQFLNGIITNYKTAAVKIDDDVTWQAHCAAAPIPTTVYCSATVGVPVGSGRVFVSRSIPNPFRNQIHFNFVLPQAGNVRVEVYSASGQRVAALAPGTLGAGEHTLTWSVDRQTPSGVYFYKVLADGGESTGKIVRVD